MIIFTVSVEAYNWYYQAQSKTKGPVKGGEPPGGNITVSYTSVLGVKKL